MSLCSDGLSSDDPYFLINFIMSHYLGPDVFSDIPRCSASQRLFKRLPPYTPKHIGSSSLTVTQLQNLYYYLLRNASSTLLLHPDMVLMYLKGYLPMEQPSGEVLLHQFTHYFPTSLHPQKRYSPSLEVVKGIVVIDDPDLAFISEEELRRFRCLSGLDELKIDRVVSLSPRPVKLLDESRGTEQGCVSNGNVTSNGLVTTNQVVSSSEELEDTSKRKKEEEEAIAGAAVCVVSEKTAESISGDIPQRKEKEKEKECSSKEEEVSNGLVTNQDSNSSAEPRETCKRKKAEEDACCGIISKTPERFRETYKRRRFRNSSTNNKNGETLLKRDKTDQPTSPPLVSVPPPVMKECDAEPVVVTTTGTASRGTSIGVVDIGVNNFAYFFQVALPGVSKENGEFSCEIKSDGEVILEGITTTGQKTIERYSRVFKMKSRKLCPPGPFKLSFSLPGPVDPRFVCPVFRSDGIFEAVVIRQKKLDLKPEFPSS
ncbi:Increased DNA methylation 3 [Hirschfeldia incana]|nr:Increased DNA methylation 3 [Hirschfeldia incana]